MNFPLFAFLPKGRPFDLCNECTKFEKVSHPNVSKWLAVLRKGSQNSQSSHPVKIHFLCAFPYVGKNVVERFLICLYDVKIVFGRYQEKIKISQKLIYLKFSLHTLD